MSREISSVLVWVGVAAMLVVGGCAGAPRAAGWAAPVAQVGQMRAVMREGKSEPRVDLAEAVAGPHGFAVGAAAGLHGEVTIRDGEVWVTRVVAGRPEAAGPRPRIGDRATLLTIAHVRAWSESVLSGAVEGSALEAMIERRARERGIDTSKPFPFRVEGGVASLDMHVVNGFCPHGGGELSEANQPWRFAGAPPARTSIVGFFASGAEGVMTHHGTAIHAHAIFETDAGMVTGHVDAMRLAPGAVLLLPVAGE